MPYNLKSLCDFPLDVSTVVGPTILPARGELKKVDLGALDAEVMRQSPYVEISEVDPLDHDADGRKGGAVPAADLQPAPKQAPRHSSRRGKKR